MKIKPCFSVLASVCCTFFLFTTIEVLGQTAKKRLLTKNLPVMNDVEAVSARIAYLYGADATIVEAYVQAAVDLESRTGIAAPVVVAIAIHESSFNSELFWNSGNPFGIKASRPWKGSTYTMWHDGEDTEFRVYNSAEAAVWDFAKFIKSRPWYADALACPMDDYFCFIDGLKRSNTQLGYSMNPFWDEAVLDIIYRIDLQPLTVH